MKANKEEVLRQIEGVLRRSKKLIADAETEKDRAAGLAMCEGYLQAFYFSGIISREEYDAFREGVEKFRKADDYRRRQEKGTHDLRKENESVH